MLTNKNLKKVLDELEYLKKVYRKNHARDVKIDWNNYDTKKRKMRKEIICAVHRDVGEAASQMIIEKETTRGRPPHNKVLLAKILLIKELFGIDNRDMDGLCSLFILDGGEDISYKTIERAYSDDIVLSIIHNLFVKYLPKGKELDCSSDGSGSVLFVGKHYRTEKEKNKGKVKKRDFMLTVKILDLKTRKIVAYAAGFKSEKKLFIEAKQMLERLGYKIKSIRLDKYYSHQSIMDLFDNDTQVYVIPKSNATIQGNLQWKKMIEKLLEDTMAFLKQYFLRSNSETVFYKLKNLFGKIRQKRQDRRIAASFIRDTLYNLSVQAMT